MGIKVRILDRYYTLKSNQSEEYLQSLASYVDEKIRRIILSNPSLPSEDAGVLAALNIADEYHRLKEKKEKASRLLSALLSRLEKKIK